MTDLEDKMDSRVIEQTVAAVSTRARREGEIEYLQLCFEFNLIFCHFDKSKSCLRLSAFYLITNQ